MILNLIYTLDSELCSRKILTEVKNYEKTKNAHFWKTQFSEKAISAKKTLRSVKGKLKSEFSNTTPAFEKYLESSGGENLFIRNQDLVQFIVAAKGKRLADISDIIGYSDINETKAVLRKALGDVKAQLKIRAFDNIISQKQAQIATQLKATVNNDEQFIADGDNFCRHCERCFFHSVRNAMILSAS